MSWSMKLILLVGLLGGERQCSEFSEKCPDPCTCWNPTNDGKILSMDCSKKEMTHILSEWPQNTTHLVVSYAHNPLVQLQKLPPIDAKTISISFKNCSIEDIDTGLFIDATTIEFLDLSWNLLESEDIHADIFRGSYSDEQYEPISLMELNLAYNRIGSLQHRVFEHTPNLVSLDLSGNPLRILDDNTWLALTSLVHLRFLNISNTGLTKLLDQQALEHKLHSIIQLDLSNNQLKSVPPSLAAFLETLEKLEINNNPMQELDDQSFIGLSNLRELQICNMKNLRYIKHNTFSKLKHLRTLHLNHNPALVHIYEGAFGLAEDRPPIVELYINDNNLRELSPALLNWSTVTLTRLHGNHWACPCETAPPCSCQSVSGRSLDGKDDSIEKASSSINRRFFILVPLVLGLVAGVICWRVLVKYRHYRAVNTTYPVLYSAPMSPAR